MLTPKFQLEVNAPGGVEKVEVTEPVLDKLTQELIGTKTIPALTIWQPWTWLIAEELKEFETRGWATKYRGPLAIHAAARKVRPSDLTSHLIDALVSRDQFSRDLPLSAVVCVVDLVDCIPAADIMDKLSDREKAVGLYAPGRYAWKLANVRKFPAIPAKGAQGLWRWTVPDNVKGLMA